MGQALISIITRKPIKDRVEEKDPRAAGTLLIPDRRIKNNKILQATPIKYNIIVDSSGYCLWINLQGVLSDGAPDADNPSAQFNVVIPDADSSTFRLVTLAFQPPKLVAADFSSDPAQLVIVDQGTPGVITEFKFEGNDITKKISVTDSTSLRTKHYWSIDPSDSTTVILSPDVQSAATFLLREITAPILM
ncbi:hypothetical protein EMCRGX_G004835 [Ephydatia muelleri]